MFWKAEPLSAAVQIELDAKNIQPADNILDDEVTDINGINAKRIQHRKHCRLVRARESCIQEDEDVLLDQRIALGVACVIPGIGRTVNHVQNEQMGQVILKLNALTANASTQTANLAALTANLATLTTSVAILTDRIDAIQQNL